MDKLKKWALRGLMGVAALAAILVLAVFSASEILLGKTYTAVERQFAVPEGAEADAEIIAEGGRLARIRGCYGGCHGSDGAGGNIFGVAVPNLTKYVREHSDTDLERAIRQGIRPDGTSVIDIMPSGTFRYLSDRDLGSIVAFFRSLPVADNDPGSRSFGLQLRAFLLYREHVENKIVRAVDGIAATDFSVPDDRSNPATFGRYLAMSICVECHEADLHGGGGFAPDLIVTGGYSEEEFRHLMATGETMDGRDLGLMADMGRRRFTHLHAEEADAIYAWLTSDEFIMAERE